MGAQRICQQVDPAFWRKHLCRAMLSQACPQVHSPPQNKALCLRGLQVQSAKLGSYWNKMSPKFSTGILVRGGMPGRRGQAIPQGEAGLASYMSNGKTYLSSA